MSEANSMDCRVGAPRVRKSWECSTEGHYTYKGRAIGIARDSKNDDWYIIVTAPCGMRDYDGWWRNSSGKTHREAVLEALRGAMLWPNTTAETRQTAQKENP